MAGDCPRPRGQQGGHPPTFPHAGQGQGELAHEVIAGGAVVVLHHEAHQGQLGCPQLETQRLLPARVEAYSTTRVGVGTATTATVATRATRHPGHKDQLDPPVCSPLPWLSCHPALGCVKTGLTWGVEVILGL